LKLGLILLAINLVYVVNLYTLWFTSAHTQALFGLVLYLWLGSYAAHNFEKISSFLTRIPTSVFFALCMFTGVAAYGEALVLLKIHNPDPLNTLRLSNQIFSICMVLLIFKFRRATWPAFMDVRNHTFGIYLSHSVLLRAFTGLLRHSRRPFKPGSLYARDVDGVLVWIGLAVATYACCLLVTRWLAGRSSLQWTVGLASQDVPRADLTIADGGLMPSQ
jgi:surface polysaccharide O-acyltransferase-like enzyme